MSALAELQKKKNDLAVTIRQYGERYNQAKAWKDGEEAKAWEKINADYDAVVAEITTAQAAINVQSRLDMLNSQPDIPGFNPYGSGGNAGQGGGVPGGKGGDGGTVVTDEHRSLAIAGWMRYQMGGDLTRHHKEAARLAGINPRQRQLKFKSPGQDYLNGLAHKFSTTHPSKIDTRNPAAFYNAPMTVGTGSTGGHLRMPESLHTALEVNMLAFAGMRQVAELMVTQTGEPFSWPTADDTGNTGVQIGENSDLAAAGVGGPVPTIGKVTWNAYKLSSQAILVPYELLEDNVVDLPRVLGNMMGERIGRFSNTRYTTGTGSSQARGILTAATLGVTAASATVITTDEVYDLQHSVDPAYRNGAAFMCADTVLLHLRKKKDSQGQYIWQSGFNTGVPDTLADAPIFLNQAMPAIATGNKTLLYGQLSQYKIRRVNGFRLYRLEERYRDQDQDGFILLVREDGNLLSAGTPPVKFLQQL